MRADQRTCFVLVVILVVVGGRAIGICRGEDRTPTLEMANKRITVRIYNFARVPHPMLLLAEHGAKRIFHYAGIQSVWLNCRILSADPPTPACEQPLAPAEFSLRVISSILPGVTDGAAFGLALPGQSAYVFYGQILDLAQTVSTRESDLLGAVFAHEIGHLLGFAHSQNGIMSPSWTSEELELINLGRLQFTPEQTRH